MTDSIDNRGKPLTPEQLEKLKSLPVIEAEDRTELSDLPGWAKTAIVYKALFDISYEDTLEMLRIKRTPGTLVKYVKTPAGRKLRDMVKKYAEDPIALAEAFLRSTANQITIDRLLFLEMAKLAGDYAEADRIARDMQDRIPELAKKSPPKGGHGGTLHITIAGGKLEPIMIDSTHQIAGAVDADYEIEDG